jgi:regulator of protease activity HflC (stomatin/prohibitin superfamily)|tara:strand:- start:38 stop:286 length:249 start_codon:yes stop_codon:yes gene_type:complete
MTKKLVINPENPNGILVDYTSEEEAQRTTDIANAEAEATAQAEAKAQAEADKEANDALKASAKAKLIAGEALTEDEANTVVI